MSAKAGPDDVIFLFKRGRLERLNSDGEWPSEFFYGYVEMKNSGASVELLDESAFGFDEPMSPGWTLLSRLSVALFGIHAWAVQRLARRLERFSTARTVARHIVRSRRGGGHLQYRRWFEHRP